MILLLSARCGTGVIVGVDVAASGTGLRLGLPGASLLMGVSISPRLVSLRKARVGGFRWTANLN